MEVRGSIVSLVLAASLGGCATTSFAPPSVNLENAMFTRGSNRLVQSCRPYKRDPKVPIGHDVAGTLALIDNFVLSYRCAAHSSANGRQIFEVPTLLTAAGAATAVAFGAGADVAIAGGAATALLGAGKGYYSPQEKAAIFDSALDALLCIKTEAVAIDAFTVGAIAATETQTGAQVTATLAATRVSPPGGVAVSAEERYFQAVQAALLSVERVLATRLSRVGRFDTAGVIAEIKLLEEESKPTDTVTANAGAAAQSLTGGGTTSGAVRSAITGLSQSAVAETIIDLAVFQPKLQQCVVRAKI